MKYDYVVRGSFENPGGPTLVFAIPVTILKQTAVCISGDGTRPHEREIGEARLELFAIPTNARASDCMHFLDFGTRHESEKMTSHVLKGIKQLTVLLAVDLSTRPTIMSMIFAYGLAYYPFPGSHCIRPFHYQIYEHSEDEGKEHPRTVRFVFVTSRLDDLTKRVPYRQVVEMRMCAPPNAIWEKHNWWGKIKDSALVEKWTQEALDQQKDEYRIRQLTRKVVDVSRRLLLT